jgi:hypothetical protein
VRFVQRGRWTSAVAHKVLRRGIVARYAVLIVTRSQAPQGITLHNAGSAVVRDPLAANDAVLAARRRPMSERLELALSWNAVAAELRAGLAVLAGHADDSR